MAHTALLALTCHWKESDFFHFWLITVSDIFRSRCSLYPADTPWTDEYKSFFISMQYGINFYFSRDQ